MKERKIWIDWMKVIGMLFIVWGHFTPDLMKNFIYAFNVPLFFFISGGLTKAKCGGGKLFKSLIVPYIIIALILIMYNNISAILSLHLNWNNIGRTTLAFIMGEQQVIVSSEPEVAYLPGCGTMWFVYALILIKVLFRSTNRVFLYLSLPISLALAYLIPHYKPLTDYAIFTVPLAWFFYVSGYLFMNNGWFATGHKWLKESLKKKNISTIILFVFILFLSVVLFSVGELNGQLKFYKAEWGETMVFMLLGSYIGIAMIYLISICLDAFNVKGKTLTTISNGTIIILAFHVQVIYIMYRTFLNGRNDWVTFILSILIMIMFIPVIKFVSKNIPIMIGGRK